MFNRTFPSMSKDTVLPSLSRPQIVAATPAAFAVILFSLRESAVETAFPSTRAEDSPTFNSGAFGAGIVVVDDGIDVDVGVIDDREDGSEVDVPLDATANGVGTVDEVPPGAIVLTEL
jgi:hypothetical protein